MMETAASQTTKSPSSLFLLVDANAQRAQHLSILPSVNPKQHAEERDESKVTTDDKELWAFLLCHLLKCFSYSDLWGQSLSKGF